MRGFVLSGALSLFSSNSVGGQDVWARADSVTVRLPPAAFDTLPALISLALENRACQIPQSYVSDRPHNVIRGDFDGQGADDWAVLCSRNLASSIFVFWSGDTIRVDSLSSVPDRRYLQGMGGDLIVFSRVIAVVSVTELNRLRELLAEAGVPANGHDAVNDAFAGKASEVWYWHGGRWLSSPGAD